MVLSEKAFKAVKWTAYTLEAAFLVVFIILCVAVNSKNRTISGQKAELKAQSEQIDSLNCVVGRLWGMDCITVNTICNIQQKGLVNTTASTQISKSVAEYTRGEILTALDSITRANNGK